MTVAPTLTTPRLILRPIGPEDWEPYAAAWSDPVMTQYAGGPRDRNTNWNRLAAAAGLWSLCGCGYWSFVERATGRWVGLGGLGRFERGVEELEGQIESGWAIIPDAWGMGYATEAMAAALDWADTVLGVPEVRCIIDPENVASVVVAEKLGFKKLSSTADSIGPVDVFRKPFARAIS